MSRPVWAGVLPMALQPRAPVAESAAMDEPDYVLRWQKAARQSDLAPAAS